METVLLDMRFAFRTLVRRPLFTVVAIATLGLGIGASTTVFSVVDGTLLWDSPYEDPDRLVVVSGAYKLSRPGDVQLSPSPVPRRFLHVTDVNSESCTIDQQVDRLIVPGCTKWNLAELLMPPGQRCVIRNWGIQIEQLGQRSKEALRLTKWEMKDHTDRQSRLDSDTRIGALTAGLAAGRFLPRIDCIL